MAPLIRDFDPDADGERVAALYNQLQYGPVRAGVALSRDGLEAVFRERGVELFLIAEDGGRIVGTIGFARVSGRRVAPFGELFACMFVIAPSHRSGFLAGQLFSQSFVRVMERDVKTLRVEVDPSNRRAYPLYIRVGFRAIREARPDEDGYIELVSHLPHVARSLLEAFRDDDSVIDLLPRLDWRTLRAAGNQTLASGVLRQPDGSWTVTYELSIGSRNVAATVDAHTGHISSVSVDGVLDERFKPIQPDETPAQPAARGLSRHLGNFVVELSPEGALSLRHPRHLGRLLIDPMPGSARFPVSARRPGSMTAEISADDTSWTSVAMHGGRAVKRSLTFDGGRLTVVVEVAEGTDVVVAPWSGMRTAELQVHTADGSGWTAHAVRGLWPPDLTDFEAVSPANWPALGTTVTWANHALGLRVSYRFRSEGMVRAEGYHFARLEGPGPIVSYEVVLVDLGQDDQPQLEAGETLLAAHHLATPWIESGWGGRKVLTIGDGTRGSRLVVAPEGGVVEWDFRGRCILSAPFPSTKHIGPLPSVTAAVWVAQQGDRAELEQGVEWALQDASLPFASRNGWSVAPSPDFSSLLVSVDLESLTMPEAAIYVCVPGHQTHVDIEDSRGEPQRIPISGVPWRAWTRTATLPLTGGGGLRITPESGQWPEILVRSTTVGVLSTLLVRHNDPPAARVRSWRLSYLGVEGA